MLARTNCKTALSRDVDISFNKVAWYHAQLVPQGCMMAEYHLLGPAELGLMLVRI
jgi:hypothetical protein